MERKGERRGEGRKGEGKEKKEKRKRKNSGSGLWSIYTLEPQQNCDTDVIQM